MITFWKVSEWNSFIILYVADEGGGMEIIMETKEIYEEVNPIGVEKGAFYLGYDKSPALPFTKVDIMTTGTVVKIIGFYIGGLSYNPYDRAEDHSAKSFTKELRRQYLTKVKLAYLYVGRTDNEKENKVLVSENPTIAQQEGETDAKEAVRLAENLEIPKDSVIYLDIEGGTVYKNSSIKDYVEKWVGYINNQSKYWAGIYCSAGYNNGRAEQLYGAANGKVNMYVAKWAADDGYYYNTTTGQAYLTSPSCPARWYSINPAEEVPNVGCIIIQYSGNVYIDLWDVITTVDQISSSVPDPSVKQF